jgi:hypothetical protein
VAFDAAHPATTSVTTIRAIPRITIFLWFIFSSSFYLICLIFLLLFARDFLCSLFTASFQGFYKCISLSVMSLPSSQQTCILQCIFWLKFFGMSGPQSTIIVSRWREEIVGNRNMYSQLMKNDIIDLPVDCQVVVKPGR